MEIYTKDTIHELNWRQEWQYLKDYILPFIKDSPTNFIANANSEVALLQSDDQLFPIVISNKNYNSTYVCSPYTAYSLYSKEELLKLDNKLLQCGLDKLINITSFFLRSAQINKVISVNNFLISTNLYPNWSGKTIASITNFLAKKFPDHVIMFRSLNKYLNAELLNNFARNNYSFIPTRQIYLFDKKKCNSKKKKNIKRDINLLKKTTYTICYNNDIDPSDYPRIIALYNQLYLDKYSKYNPKFTEKLIALWHKKNLLSFQGLRNSDGILDGISGSFERNGVYTTPLLGYDTNLSKSLGLYRLLVALISKRALEKDTVIRHASSGASTFKIFRGCFPEIEYSAIYTMHLSLYRRGIWHLLSYILKTIAVPIIKRYNM